MRKFFLVACVLLGASVASAAQYMSASNCQPYQIGGSTSILGYYQNLGGTILSVAPSTSNLTLSCPVNTSTAPQNIQVRVYYSTAQSSVIKPIGCRINKIAFNGLTAAGTMIYGNQGLNYSYFDVYNTLTLSGAVGVNIDCILKGGAKLLAYYVY
jgi:hypothetical protein